MKYDEFENTKDVRSKNKSLIFSNFQNYNAGNEFNAF